MSNIIEFTLPAIEDLEGLEIVEVLVAVGDIITSGQDVLSLESEKAVIDVPSNLTGQIIDISVSIGDTPSIGDLILTLEGVEKSQTEPSSSPIIEQPKATTEVSSGKSIAAAIVAQAMSKKAAPTPAPELVEIAPYAPDNTAGVKHAHASPSVRQFARELGVTLSSLTGSGVKGRITKEDVQNFVKQKVNAPAATTGGAIPPVPVINFEKFGDVENVDLSRIKKISGKHLHACWLNIPHVTQFDEADITELEQFRKENKDAAAKQGVNLTPLVFVMKAVVASLKKFPELNSSLSEDKQHLIIKSYYNIGVAVDTPNGLMVPVIKDVDKKGFLELAGELGEISGRARDGALTAKDLQGGTFSISSLGGIGGSFFTPIVNAPEVAILGVGRHKMQPVWNGKEFEPKLMLPLSVSYDHRVVDGALGARFVTHLNQMLSDIRKVLL
jgi:pyruvate dehydrogenase E2 component (dihydrolipoamide acetyltransferase)